MDYTGPTEHPNHPTQGRSRDDLFSMVKATTLRIAQLARQTSRQLLMPSENLPLLDIMII